MQIENSQENRARNCNLRLMMVDDEINFLATIAKRLMRRGFNIRTAESASQCLRMLRDEPVDVLISDVKMPGMSGIDLLREVKQNYPRVEVILLTGHDSSQDGVAGIRGGAFDYLTKPVELEHLIQKIDQAYDGIMLGEMRENEKRIRRKMKRDMAVTERLAALGTLASGVAHEINNPLAIINEAVGWMRLLLKKPDLEKMPRKEAFESALEKIETSVARACKITHQLLGVVRHDDTVFSEIDPLSLIDDTLLLVAKAAQGKGIRIERHLPPVFCKIWVDPNPLRQILINLLTNAIYASEENSTIDLWLKNEPDHVFLTVQDYGCGIPGENLERVFEPFFSTKPPNSGTGLGLYVTRGMVEKIGGRISLESKVGQGTQVEIMIPRRPALSSVGNREGHQMVNDEKTSERKKTRREQWL